MSEECQHKFKTIETFMGEQKSFFGLFKSYVKVFILECEKCGTVWRSIIEIPKQKEIQRIIEK